MRIKIYDNGGISLDRYTVIIDKDVYLMSSSPIQGICAYFGKSRNILITGKEVAINNVPILVQCAIYRLKAEKINCLQKLINWISH